MELINHNLSQLEKLKSLTVKDLLRFFEQHKKKDTVSKIKYIFNLVNVQLTEKEILKNNYEKYLREYEQMIHSKYVNLPKTFIIDDHGQNYSLYLWINRFLNWKQ